MFAFIKNWFDRKFSDPQIIILGFLLAFGAVLILMLGKMLTPVFIAVVISYLLEGMIPFLQRMGIPRFVAVIIVFLLFMACLLVLLVVLLPMLSRQVGQFLQELPSMISRGQKVLAQLPERYPAFVSEQQIKHVMNLLGTELTNLVQRILTLSLASVRGLISLLIYVVLVPLLVFFFLKDKQLILDWISAFLPENRKLAAEVWTEVNTKIGSYVRGKIWEILIIWGASYITFKLIGLNFTMLLSLFTGLSVIVPYIGATVVFFPVLFISYFQWGWGSEFAYAVMAYGIIQAIDGNLLAPLLLSEVVKLHPVAIIVAVLVFGGLWGIWGLFFAIPLATLVHAVMKAWISKRTVPPDETIPCST